MEKDLGWKVGWATEWFQRKDVQGVRKGAEMGFRMVEMNLGLKYNGLRWNTGWGKAVFL